MPSQCPRWWLEERLEFKFPLRESEWPRSYSCHSATLPLRGGVEPKEVLGGYWLVEALSLEEVVKWAQRCQVDEGDITKIRQVFGLRILRSRLAYLAGQAKIGKTAACSDRPAIGRSDILPPPQRRLWRFLRGKAEIVSLDSVKARLKVRIGVQREDAIYPEVEASGIGGVRAARQHPGQ